MEEKAISRYPDICVCCGKPVPEGRMVCYTCETGNQTMAPCGPTRHAKGIRKILGLKKEKVNESRV